MDWESRSNVEGLDTTGSTLLATRRGVLAAGGAVALGSLAGCSALDGLLNQAGEQVVGTTVSAPAAFYAGQGPPPYLDADSDGFGVEFAATGNIEVRAVPATVRAGSREFELEGWSTSTRHSASPIPPKALAGKPPRTLSPGENTDDNEVDEADFIEYLENEPTIGERFTICLPDAKLPGDRGSLAEELTLDRALAYFAPSREPNGVRAPFHEQYGSQGIEYDDDGCIQIDGPVSLHKDIACQNILSAELDTYRTANRGIVGYGTAGGAVVSAAPVTSDTIGKRVFLTTDVTGEIILGEDRDMVMPGDNVESGSQTLVCPVAVTPEGCPSPLPGMFYVRRIIHDDQIIFAGGWILDEGALFEDSVTLLFDEGSTEVASVTPEDIESDNYGDRIVGQFSRDRSQLGSLIGIAQGQETEMNKAELIESMASEAFQTDQGRKGLNAVNVKVLGEVGGGGDGDDGSDDSIQLTATALDAPLVHLANAAGTGNDVKFKAGAELSKAVN